MLVALYAIADYVSMGGARSIYKAARAGAALDDLAISGRCWQAAISREIVAVIERDSAYGWIINHSAG